MNYLKAYVNICRLAKTRVLSKNIDIERHHIFPKSIYGQNRSVVKLTLREHVLVHWLLYKEFLRRYGPDSKKTSKMSMAFHWMIYGKGSTNRRNKIRPTTRMYESARQAAIVAKKGKSRPDMVGKKYFGADAATISRGIKKNSENRTGKKINYPSDRKGSPRNSTVTVSKISESRLKTNQKYINMTDQQFTQWLSTCKMFMKDGRRNGNVIRAIISRGDLVNKYYEEIKND